MDHLCLIKLRRIGSADCAVEDWKRRNGLLGCAGSVNMVFKQATIGATIVISKDNFQHYHHVLDPR